MKEAYLREIAARANGVYAGEKDLEPVQAFLRQQIVSQQSSVAVPLVNFWNIFPGRDYPDSDRRVAAAPPPEPDMKANPLLDAFRLKYPKWLIFLGDIGHISFAELTPEPISV